MAFGGQIIIVIMDCFKNARSENISMLGSSLTIVCYMVNRKNAVNFNDNANNYY